MQKAFLAFNDRAVALGIQDGSPSLAEQLRATTSRLDELVRSKAIDSNAEEEEQDEFLEAETRELEETQSHPRQTAESSRSTQVPAYGYRSIIHEEADNDDDGETAQKAPVTQAQFEDLPLSDWTSTEAMQHYQTEMSTTYDAATALAQTLEEGSARSSDAHSNHIFDSIKTAQQAAQELPFGLMPLPREDGPVNGAPSASTSPGLLSLPSPKSYAHQEASFTRRLMRTALETGYRIMTDPTSKPEDLQRLCKFTRCFVTDPRIINHLEAMLQRSASESLEWRGAPVKNVGGAGLHYQRSDADGSLPRDWMADAQIGPLPPLQAETPMPNCTTTRQIVDRVGCDGEWFDPSDVEQYLRSKGLYLDGQSSIVELNEDKTLPALVDTQGPSEDSPDASSHVSTVEPRSPQDADMAWLDGQFLQESDCLTAEYALDASEIPKLGMDIPLGDTDTFGRKTIFPNSDVNMFSENVPTFNTNIKKFFDVEKFVHSTFLIVLAGLIKKLTQM